MRNRTNLLLVNLAFADLSVAVFGVYPNLFFYIADTWAVVEFYCKVYRFVQTLSYTAGIFFTTLMAVEKYIAIVHPLWSRLLLTRRKILVAMTVCWILTIVFCIPHHFARGEVEAVLDTSCTLYILTNDNKLYDALNFLVCFVIPLITMTILYSLISISIFQSAVKLGFIEEPKVLSVAAIARHSLTVSFASITVVQSAQQKAVKKLLAKRCRVIKLLIILVAVFAFCTFPFFMLNLLQNFIRIQHSKILAITALSNLLLFAKSAANPFLYALYSTKFRETLVQRFRTRQWFLHHGSTRRVAAMSNSTTRSNA